MNHELAYADLMEVSRLLRHRELRVADLLEQMLARIDTLDARLGAFAFVSADSARADARRADQEFRHGYWRGPLHGVPVAVKDIIDTAGIPTEGGMKLLRGNIPEADATCVARLRRAGAVVLGKTITSEAAFIEHSHQPAPRNPWSSQQSSGISSSGSGVAVAAGLCYASLGTDTGGSIRLPSALNGITGLKPSWGRVSRYGVLPVAPQFDVIGPMTRTAADAAAVLQAIAGADAKDPVTIWPVPSYLDGIDAGISAQRVGIDESFLAEVCDDAVLTTILDTLSGLETLGARGVAVTLPPLDPEQMMNQTQAALAASHRDNYPSRADEYGASLRQSLEAGRQMSAMDLMDSVNAGDVLRTRMNRLFDHIDLLLMPAVPTVGRPVNSAAGLETALEMKRATVTMAFSVTGHPTITLPAGVIQGLPVGIQLVARHFNEAQLLRAGHAWQQLTGYHRERPPQM